MTGSCSERFVGSSQTGRAGAEVTTRGATGGREGNRVRPHSQATLVQDDLGVGINTRRKLQRLLEAAPKHSKQADSDAELPLERLPSDWSVLVWTRNR